MNICRRLYFEFFYMRRPPWDSGISPPELMTWLETQTPGRAIDLGCGTGTNALTLALRGWQVTGVDFSIQAIAAGRKKLAQVGQKADLRVGDVTHLDNDLTGPYDFALDLGCFHGLDENDKAAYLLRLSQIMAPGGNWLLYAFLSDQALPGVSPTDLEKIRARFALESYQEGMDRRERRSAYFLFKKN